MAAGVSTVFLSSLNGLNCRFCSSPIIQVARRNKSLEEIHDAVLAASGFGANEITAQAGARHREAITAEFKPIEGAAELFVPPPHVSDGHLALTYTSREADAVSIRVAVHARPGRGVAVVRVALRDRSGPGAVRETAVPRGQLEGALLGIHSDLQANGWILCNTPKALD